MEKNYTPLDKEKLEKLHGKLPVAPKTSDSKPHGKTDSVLIILALISFIVLVTVIGMLFVRYYI